MYITTCILCVCMYVCTLLHVYCVYVCTLLHVYCVYVCIHITTCVLCVCTYITTCVLYDIVCIHITTCVRTVCTLTVGCKMVTSELVMLLRNEGSSMSSLTGEHRHSSCYCSKVYQCCVSNWHGIIDVINETDVHLV